MTLKKNISALPGFIKLQASVFSDLGALLGNSDSDINGVVSALRGVSVNFDLRQNLDSMFELERLTTPLLKELGWDRELVSLQFPQNLRIFPNILLETGRSRKFSTTYPHCDVWSGAPSDSINFLLYLYSEPGSASTKIFREISDLNLRAYRGSYQDVRLSPLDCELCSEVNQTGDFSRFSTFTLHQSSNVSSRGIRVSADFRARVGSPYFFNDIPISLTDFIESSPGRPGLGYYWCYPTETLCTLSQKIEYELEMARIVGAWALKLRLAYLERVGLM